MTKPTDIVSNIDTTGIFPGPTSDVRGTTPVFDLAEEQTGKADPQDLTLEERFKKLSAVGSQPPEDESPEGDNEDASDDEVNVNETIDTSGTDVPTSPSAGQSSESDEDEGDGEGDDESSEDEGEDESSEESPEGDADERQALAKNTVPELLALAEEKGIDIPSGSLKDDIITLILAG